MRKKKIWLLGLGLLLIICCMTSCQKAENDQNKEENQKNQEMEQQESQTSVEDESKDAATQAVSNTDDYIIPESSIRLLTQEEVKSLSAEKLRIARNEIYARHGRIFTSEDLKTYFESKSWYKGTVAAENFDEKLLNSYEKENIVLLQEMEKMAAGNSSSAENGSGNSGNGNDSSEISAQAPCKKVIDSYGYYGNEAENRIQGSSVLQFNLQKGTLKDCGTYYQVEAVFTQGIEAPGNLEPGDEITLVFDELTGEKQTLIYTNGALYPIDQVESGMEYYYQPSEDGSPVVLYQMSDDRVDKPVYQGTLWIKKDATEEIPIIQQVSTITAEQLNAGSFYTNLFFDENGYVTRLMMVGD